ncbi:hypothetical protein [Symbiopectobacterium sp. RP]|uniref:hypothetical protein n=1 Tax=Symbiopectobacterium sp. RP TaxID=3248553 RepID=UPI003D2770E4
MSVKLAMRKKEDYTRKAIMDCTLNTIASRASVIVSAYTAACALPFSGHAASAIVGTTMGTAYTGFVYAHNQNSIRNKSSRIGKHKDRKKPENRTT